MMPPWDKLSKKTVWYLLVTVLATEQDRIEPMHITDNDNDL